MPMIDLVGQSFKLAERNLSSARTINWVPEIYGAEERTKSKMALIPVPGTETVLEVGADELSTCRGLYLSSSGPAPNFNPRLYGVWGTGFYRFDENNQNPQKLGEIGNFGASVSIDNNYFDVLVADGQSLYATPMNAADGLATLRAVPLPFVPGSTTQRVRPTHVAVIAQRIYINNSQGNTFSYSKLGATEFETSSDANFDFYSAESSSDPIVALKLVNGALWVWGTRSYEIWRTQNNVDDPLSYVGGSQSAIGCKARHSVASIADMCFWLGASDVGSDQVYMGVSTEAIVVSTTAIHHQISQCGDRSSAVGWCYAEGGSIFYVLTFKSSGSTFVYDASTKMWHERLRRRVSNGSWEAYNYVHALTVGDQLYCGTMIDNALCKMTSDALTDHDGNPIVRQRVTPTYFDELYSVMLKELVIDCNVGTTTFLNGQGSDPLLILEISKDGGSTYGNLKTKSLGKQGMYKRLVRWHATGMGRELVFRITCSEPLALAIYQARLDYDKCARE